MKQLLSILTLLLVMTSLNGKELIMNAISTAGSPIETNGFVVSRTIGEYLIDFTLPDAAMRQPLRNKSDAMEMKNGTLLKMYPTLTTGQVTVEIRNTEQTNLKIELPDLKGTILKIISVDADKLQEAFDIK